MDCRFILFDWECAEMFFLRAGDAVGFDLFVAFEKASECAIGTSARIMLD